MDMDKLMEEMGGSESGAPMGNSEKVAKIKALVSEAKALADDCGYDIGEAMKDLKMNAAQPDDSSDMEEAGEAYEEGMDDSPEMGDEDKSKNKALAIAVLKKKKMEME